MQKFEKEDIPLVIDSTFALAVHAYSLALFVVCKQMGDSVPKDFSIQDVLMNRFLGQGFDKQRSEKVSKMINEVVNRMVFDAFKELG